MRKCANFSYKKNSPSLGLPHLGKIKGKYEAVHPQSF